MQWSTIWLYGLWAEGAAFGMAMYSFSLAYDQGQMNLKWYILWFIVLILTSVLNLYTFPESVKRNLWKEKGCSCAGMGSSGAFAFTALSGIGETTGDPDVRPARPGRTSGV